MIKKILLVMLMMSLSLILFNQQSYAATILEPEPAANTGGLWHEEDGNRVYINMRYTNGGTVIETGSYTNSAYPDYDYSEYTVWESGSESDFRFPLTSLYNDYDSISNPNPELYDSFHVEIISNITTIAGAEPETKIISVYDDNISNIEIQMTDWDNRDSYLYDYSYIELSVDGTQILTSRNVNPDVTAALGYDTNLNYNDMTFGVRMYWEAAETTEEINPGTDLEPWLSLPDTSGSPLNPVGDWGTVSNIILNNTAISFDVEYNGITYPVNSFNVAGDLDFISEANDVLYFTDSESGDRILYFNFGETLDSAILTATSFNDVNVWKGEALWNLTQDEIKVTDTLTVYNYIPEVDDDGNVYSYFYMPDVEMDSLISVTSLVAYRYFDNGFFPWSDLEAGEIQYKTVTAAKGETTAVNPSWVENTYKTAYISSGVMAAATLTVGFIPVYGWGVAGAFFLIGGAMQISDVQEWWAYDVNQIENVIPGISLSNEINNYISTISEDDTFTADTDKLYKLHLGVLDEYDDVQILGDESNVTQIVWETDGAITVINDADIYNPSWGGAGTNIPVNPIGDNDMEMIVYAFIGIAALGTAANMGVFKSKFATVLFLGTVSYIAYEMGLI